MRIGATSAVRCLSPVRRADARAMLCPWLHVGRVNGGCRCKTGQRLEVRAPPRTILTMTRIPASDRTARAKILTSERILQYQSKESYAGGCAGDRSRTAETRTLRRARFTRPRPTQARVGCVQSYSHMAERIG